MVARSMMSAGPVTVGNVVVSATILTGTGRPSIVAGTVAPTPVLVVLMNALVAIAGTAVGASPLTVSVTCPSTGWGGPGRVEPGVRCGLPETGVEGEGRAVRRGLPAGGLRLPGWPERGGGAQQGWSARAR